MTLSYGFLDATIGAGKLDLIRDTELRAALAGLQALQDIAEESLEPLVELGTAASVILMEYPEIQRGVASNTFDLSAPSAPILAALRGEPQLVRLASSRTMLTVGYVAGLRDLEPGLEAVVHLLEVAQSSLR